MLRRVAWVGIVATVTVVLGCSPALAWTNGPNNGNGFGTHDWILHEAVKASGETWVSEYTALPATDDPDTVYGPADRVNHMFRPTGMSKGAPQTVTDLYAKTVAAYRAGDRRAASENLGLLSHYYADVCVPFHTDYSPGDSPFHAAYENAVGDLTTTLDTHHDWITPQERELVADIRSKTVSTALHSRSRHDSLVLNYGMYGYDVVTDVITREMLSMAVNDLADIIKSVPTGSGISGPGRLSLAMSHPYPRQNSTLTASAVCKTAEGDPIEGERVSFTWTIATQTVNAVAYSDQNGVAGSKLNIGLAPKGQPATVTAIAEASGERRVSKAKFTPTDVIGTIQTKAMGNRPTQNTTVTVSTLCLNHQGEPIGGLKVTFSWYYRTKTVRYTTYTDETGVAEQSRNVGKAAAGRRVYVRAVVLAGGTTRTSWTSFVPKAKPKPKPKRVAARGELPSGSDRTVDGYIDRQRHGNEPRQGTDQRVPIG